jgi:hypothetical protein
LGVEEDSLLVMPGPLVADETGVYVADMFANVGDVIVCSGEGIASPVGDVAGNEGLAWTLDCCWRGQQVRL